MKQIGLFYGTTSGKTRNVAEQIKKEFGGKFIDIFDIREVKPEHILKYDNLIFGTSSWGVGEMQDDWETFIDEVVGLDLSKKKIALYGLGDQVEYPGSFVDGLGTLYCRIPEKDNIVGFTSTKGFDYYFSSAEKEGQFVGLAIDEDKQSTLTPDRVKKWVVQLRKEFQ